jgi:hypothetical protein
MKSLLLLVCDVRKICSERLVIGVIYLTILKFELAC